MTASEWSPARLSRLDSLVKLMSAGRKDSEMPGEEMEVKDCVKTGLLFWWLGVNVVESKLAEEVVKMEEISEAFENSATELGFFARGILMILGSLEVLSKVLSV